MIARTDRRSVREISLTQMDFLNLKCLKWSLSRTTTEHLIDAIIYILFIRHSQSISRYLSILNKKIN